MRQWQLVILLSGELGILIALASIGDLRGHVPLFIWLFVGAALLYLLAVFAGRQLRISFGVVLVVALQLRVPMFLTEPTLSDDVWRYIHDGRAQLVGTNPYRYAPADPRTEPFRGPEHARINHPHLPTIYPPVAQYTFRLMAGFADPLLAWRLLLLLAEIGTLVAGALLLQKRGLPAANLALYAWHPLAIFEGIGNAHLEPIGIAFLVLAAYWVLTGARARAGVTLALSVAAKLVALPLLLVAARNRTVALAFVATIVAVYGPFMVGGANVLGSLRIFGATWASNGSLYSVLSQVMPGDGYRMLAAIATLACVATMAVRRMEFAEAAFGFFLVLFLLSPVVHPWYLLWVLAFLALRTRPFDLVGFAALIWSISVVLSYAAQQQLLLDGVWRIPHRFLLAEYLPVYLLLIIAATAGPFSQMKLMAITRKKPAKI